MKYSASAHILIPKEVRYRTERIVEHKSMGFIRD